MASRRLAISSLLCDSVPPPDVEQPVDPIVDPVVLAPHLRAPFPQSHPRHRHSSVHSIGLEALVHAATEERRRLSAGSSTDTEPESHQPRSHHRSPSRQPEQYSHHSPTVSPPYEYQSPFSPPSRHRTQDRLGQDDSQLRLRPTDDIHHRPAYFPTPPPPPPSSHSDHEVLAQHQQLELLRQRHHHEQLLLKEQQQQRQLAWERQLVHTSASPSLPPPSRVPSVPLHLQVPSPHFSHPQLSPPTAGRKSDPGQHGSMTETRPTSAHFNLILSPKSPVPDDTSFYPTKKRRYSDSPVLPISSTGRERISPIRDNSATADCSNQRIDPLLVAVPPRSPTPASANEQKPTAAAEIVIPGEKERISVDAGESLRGGQSLLKPIARRPSPGSQIGKAKAARKSEETDTSLGPSLSCKDHHFTERERHHTAEEPRTPNEDSRRSRARPATATRSVGEGPNPRVKDQEISHRPRQSTTPPPAQDAHEWFLEHYDDLLPGSDELGASPPSPILSPVSQKQMSTAATMPEAAVALEQELEDLVVNSPTIPSKIEPEADVDMDVDLAVTELVAETLEQDSLPHVGMEVDVEDELLSLLDDQPSVPRRTSGVTTSGSTSSSSTKHPPFQAAATGSSDVRQGSPSAVSNVSLSGNVSPAIRSLSARPMSERESMPPPASVAPSRGKDKSEKKTDQASSATAPTTKKKKDVASKPPTKPKTAAKSRAKPTPKLKAKDADDAVVAVVPAKPTKMSTTPAIKNTTVSRSRSASTMPGGSVGPESEPKAEKQEEEEGSEGQDDDKLYCVCKTKYDEDRFMIACDRCDEWYHTQCVNMPDLEVDLVDQFICPPCVERNAHLSLSTTYKRRCLFGLKHADPDSAKACHKPARGAFSKYCSDECGVKYMQARLDAWAKKGGKKDKLWDSIKNAEKREGVVISANDGIVVKSEGDDCCKREEVEIKPRKRKVERELERLTCLLDQVVQLREEIKKGLEVVVWREKLIELASERAEQVDQCGWDQRLCFGDLEWADFGAGVLESYEDVKAETGQGDMQVDGVSEELGEWWCPGKKMCDRHAGWQAVRQKDICQEKEKKEDALSNLTTREREIRKRIEDIVDPQGRNSDKAGAKLPSAKQTNGFNRGKTHADASKKGKKRKAPS